MTPVPEGSAHGRFQPFHNGHLEYVLAAAAQCEFLWIGITQPEIRHLSAGGVNASHRFQPADNPLTYWERATVIRASLLEAGINLEKVGIVPFPIEDPEILQDYVPTSAVAFTTIYEEWNREKIDLLARHGYAVSVLWERDEKSVSGGEVRSLMRSGDSRWREMVSMAAAKSLEDLGIVERMQQSLNVGGSERSE
jgi:cytidyltransferase-like protein